MVVVDTGAIRPEYGDAGLGPIFDFLRRGASGARLALRPASGTGRLAAAEAGPGVAMLPDDRSGCVAAVADLVA